MTDTPDRPAIPLPPQAEAILRWHADMDLDAVVGAAPVDRFAAEAERKAARAARQERPAARGGMDTAGRSAPGQAAAMGVAAPALAGTDEAAPLDWPDFAALTSVADVTAALTAFEGCALKAMATNLCHYDGSPEARIAIIGEAPGRDEDLQGKPFVGRAGQLLDRMLAAIDLDRDKVFITNMVFWRPPGNREPSTVELHACRPFLDRTIELVDPDILLLAGNTPSKTLLETKQGITRMRGKWMEATVGGKKRRAMPMLHPAYLLRQPLQKRFAWRDLLALKEAVDAL